MKIKGVPEGYELVRIGGYDHNKDGEVLVLLACGTVVPFTGYTTAKNLVILRKAERPKQYRPFANGAEYSPHFHRQVVEANDYNMTYLPTAFDNNKVWLGPGFSGNAWDEAFRSFKFKDDGTPFGVEVSE
jgi:hypothetical protein